MGRADEFVVILTFTIPRLDEIQETTDAHPSKADDTESNSTRIVYDS